ncbi:MAG: DUF3037 domain-containing protein [Caldilineaceae bacterium]
MPEQPPVSEVQEPPSTLLDGQDSPAPEQGWRATHLVHFDSRRIADSFDRPLVSYDYAWVRLVPRVETGEFLNVGVVLYCRTRRFLGARVGYDATQVASLAPHLDRALLDQSLALIPSLCAGEGPIGALGQAEAFHWLVAPHSTVIQSSEVHTGLCADPAAELEHLAQRLRPAV